jgi:hypothetical protein
MNQIVHNVGYYRSSVSGGEISRAIQNLLSQYHLKGKKARQFLWCLQIKGVGIFYKESSPAFACGTYHWS